MVAMDHVGSPEILLDRVLCEQVHGLECACDATPADFVARVPGDVVAFNVTSPTVGRKCPAMTLNSVVFPAPLGPMMPKISPGSTANETLRDRR